MRMARLTDYVAGLDITMNRILFSAFMQGFEKTGLGRRVATIFVKWFGKSTLGLAYGLAAAEALLAPAMPSTTARAGGIFMPIINSLSRTAGSMPGERTDQGPIRALFPFLSSVQVQMPRFVDEASALALECPLLRHVLYMAAEQEPGPAGCALALAAFLTRADSLQ